MKLTVSIILVWIGISGCYSQNAYGKGSDYLLHRNGKLEKHKDLDSVKTGFWQYYDCDSNLTSQGRYAPMEIHTFDTIVDVFYDRSEEVVFYTFDVDIYSAKDSIWEYFNKDGSLNRKEYYDKGKMVLLRAYNADELKREDPYYRDYFRVERMNENEDVIISLYKWEGKISLDRATPDKLIRTIYLDKDGNLLKVETPDR